MKKPKAYPFVMIRRDLLASEEWRSLSSSAKVVYIYMRFYYNHKTHANVKLSYSQIDDMFGHQTISRAFKELQTTGFIKKTKHGGLFGGVCEYQFNGKFKDFLR